MILRELFYLNDVQSTPGDYRYDSGGDSSKLSRKDTRKTRLTLRNINKLRKASEQHILEQEKELEFIEQMYKAPAPPPM